MHNDNDERIIATDTKKRTCAWTNTDYKPFTGKDTFRHMGPIWEAINVHKQQTWSMERSGSQVIQTQRGKPKWRRYWRVTFRVRKADLYKYRTGNTWVLLVCTWKLIIYVFCLVLISERASQAPCTECFWLSSLRLSLSTCFACISVHRLQKSDNGFVYSHACDNQAAFDLKPSSDGWENYRTILCTEQKRQFLIH